VKNIHSIQVFINLIFKRLSEKIKTFKCITKEFELNKFEKEIEDLIGICINEYPKYYIKYNEINKKQLLMNDSNMRVIISELLPPIEEIYPESEYPLLKYFTYTKYRTKNDLFNSLGPEENYALKYPLLYKYLKNEEGPKLMKYLPAFNEFTNYMVDYYSYKISREDARTRSLEKEEIFKEINSNKFQPFIKAWDKIKNYAIKYKCQNEMNIKNLNQSDNLICFLNDANEFGNGMYLASACQNFISWQNSFLEHIISSAAHNGILHCYIDNMKNRIPVQDANSNQILVIENCFKNSNYNDFDDLIYSFSKRNIFNENGKIDYLKYNLFEYDFSLLEEELAKLILPGKCLFENEDKLNFITYWGEGFIGGKSESLIKFYTKYPQKDLNEEDEIKIFNYLNKGNNNDFKEFFGSMQLIIFYLINNNFKEDEKISNIILEAPAYLHIDKDCSDFFVEDGKEFKANQIMNIFFYIEHLCFDALIENIRIEYKKPIEESVKLKIKTNLIDNSQSEEKISLNDLAAALRRFISRYLVGNKEVIDVNENIPLDFQLGRIDLWGEKYGNLDNLIELVSEKIKDFNLKVCHALEFYNIIGEQDKSLLKNKFNNSNQDGTEIGEPFEDDDLFNDS